MIEGAASFRKPLGSSKHREAAAQYLRWNAAARSIIVTGVHARRAYARHSRDMDRARTRAGLTGGVGLAHIAVAGPGRSLWNPRSIDAGATLQQGHLGCLARVDREREPQRCVERDSKRVVAEVPNLIRALALGLRHET